MAKARTLRRGRGRTCRRSLEPARGDVVQPGVRRRPTSTADRSLRPRQPPDPVFATGGSGGGGLRRRTRLLLEPADRRRRRVLSGVSDARGAVLLRRTRNDDYAAATATSDRLHVLRGCRGRTRQRSYEIKVQ